MASVTFEICDLEIDLPGQPDAVAVEAALWEVEYQVSGRYVPQTYTDPAEYPIAEPIRARLLSVDGRDPTPAERVALDLMVMLDKRAGLANDLQAVMWSDQADRDEDARAARYERD